MATTTPNLGLVKPDYEDLADVAVLNDNSDTIDAAVKAVQDSVSQGAITAIVPQDYTFSVTTYTQLPLGNYTSYGDAFTLSNNAITCNKAGYVFACSSLAFIDVNDTNVCNSRISRGNTVIAQGIQRSSGSYGQPNISGIVFPVSSGDVITLSACNSSNGSGKITAGSNRSFITLVMLSTR